MTQATHAYAGFAACGCLIAATVDIPGQEKTTAADVALFIRGGLRVERLPNEEIRQRFGHTCGDMTPANSEQPSLFGEAS